eukprot:15294229-Heterocapsa_arctica.AAC.1
MEVEFPSKKVAPESRKEGQQWRPFGKPHCSEGCRARHVQVVVHHVWSFRKAPKGSGRCVYGHPGPWD